MGKLQEIVIAYPSLDLYDKVEVKLTVVFL